MSNLFAVLDLAASVPLRQRVCSLCAPDAEPLLDRERFADTLPVGPWLVDLRRCTGVTATWRRNGRWQNWGYTIRSSLDLLTLRRHLRKFNIVEAGANGDIFFRYFDPVVFVRFFGGIATPEQYCAFFKGIDVIQVEDADQKCVRNFAAPRA